MREKANQFPPAGYGPRPAYSVGRTLVGTTIVAVALLAAVMATAYPFVVAGVVVGAVLARHVVRVARRFLQTRRRKGRTRRLCVPRTNVCVEA